MLENIVQRAKSTLRDLLADSPMTRQTRKETEIDVLKSLPQIPVPEKFESGVLLSDKIEHFATEYKMIEPFSSSKLKPAAYELSVGDLYSIGGKTYTLSADRPEQEIVIKPFEVVIIQTLERLNLPKFVIARWNVRVRWAYKGLLWVGAAQVDPGYRGYLACPLYNLSDSTVRLHRGEEIAVMDFVTTTRPTVESEAEAYEPYKRSRILFEEYAPNELKSALATQAQERLHAVEQSVKELGARVDAAIIVIASAVGILVAALALFVSKEYPEVITRFSPTYLLATVALITAILAFIHSTYRHIVTETRRFVWLLIFEILMVAVLVWALLDLQLALKNFRGPAPALSSRQAPSDPNPVSTSATKH
jgi:deoxycytidine triphosphate deaminase